MYHLIGQPHYAIRMLIWVASAIVLKLFDYKGENRGKEVKKEKKYRKIETKASETIQIICNNQKKSPNFPIRIFQELTLLFSSLFFLEFIPERALSCPT
jgi:hypothetical protein